MKKILSFALVLAMCVSVALPIFAAEPECPGNVNKDHFKTNCTYTYVDTYAPKCGERGYTVYQCNGCGKYFADDFTQNLEQHDYQVTTAPTCGEAGSEKCTKCGDEQPITALEHAWTPSANICGEPGEKITQTCSNCGETREVEVTGEHDWKIVVKEEPICGKDGLAIYTCNVCGYEKEVAIDCETAEVGGHKWVFVEAVAKTCTTDGNTAGYVCDNEGCDAVAEVGDVINTVDEEGNPVQVTVASKYEVVPASHETTETYIAATCVTPGYTMYVCTVEGCGYATMEVDPNAPALGHEMPANATVTTTACAIVDGVFVPGKTVTTGICNQCGNNATVTETVNHTYTSTPVAATCTTGAYTVYTCTHSTACAAVESAKGEPVADAHKVVYIYEGSEDAANYPSLPLDGTYAPTCTEKGYCYKVCANGCGNEMALMDVPALGHDYGDPVYNCGTGMNDYTCATCGDVKSEAIEGFNKNDYTHHYDWIDNGVWNGTIAVNVDNGCGKPAIYNYTCDHCNEAILVIVTASHTVPAGWVDNANDPTCTQDGNYAWFICAKDDCKAYCYYDAEGALVVIPNAEGATTPELVENSDMPKAVVIAKTGCDIVIDKEYKAPVCGTPGQTAQWHCKNDNCDAVATYDGITVDANGNPMVKAGDEAKLTGSSALSVELTVSHAWANTDTLVLNHKYEGAATFQTRTCAEYGYKLYACTNCDAWEWRYYAQDTDHNIEKTEPECTVNGYYVCTNAWCQHRDALGNLVLNTTNPTYEVIWSEGHVDENGDPIICVAEDFWCAVCNPEFIPNPAFDENAEESETNPKMIPSGNTKLPHYESHNTAAEDWKAAVLANGVHSPMGGMYATELDYSRDCTQWSYIVYVCPDCEDDTKGGHFTVREEAPCKEHHVIAGNKEYKAADAKRIPHSSFTKIITPATFTEAGVKAAICSCEGCEQIVATREYPNEEIGFDLKVDSAIYAGADIVDSGRIEVDVLVNAYEVYAYSIYFDLAYNANHLEFVEAKLPDGSPFGESGLDAYATVDSLTNVGEAHVYLANYGEKLSNIPFDLYGEQLAVVTLVFDVKAVNATGTGKTGSAVALNDISVLDANGNLITVADEAVAPAKPNVNLNSILSESFDIYMLGNVTKGVVENQNQDARIDDFDALNWEDLYLSGEYLAAADINKNGELDSYDYDYICDYIVKAIDYYELCDK